ncbi:MAG: hypothetical protein CVU60_13550 [Deltaproteobacteria bacterium HGW-Deltaproteobacteria-18]|nr:MAG: hypothetical protein CVU60_13550 [Deltaproteobacteria bacterium HGW-Deltaproteobacteria-18]
MFGHLFDSIFKSFFHSFSFLLVSIYIIILLKRSFRQKSRKLRLFFAGRWAALNFRRRQLTFHRHFSAEMLLGHLGIDGRALMPPPFGQLRFVLQDGSLLLQRKVRALDPGIALGSLVPLDLGSGGQEARRLWIGQKSVKVLMDRAAIWDSNFALPEVGAKLLLFFIPGVMIIVDKVINRIFKIV